MSEGFFRARAGDNALCLWLPAEGAPQWVHWGRPVQGALHGRVARTAPGLLDEDPALDLCPVVGHGWMQHPALEGHRLGAAHGQDWAIAWQRIAHEVADDMWEVVLEDPRAGLRWAQRWQALAGTAVWAVRTQLTNLGDAPWQLAWLASVTLPVRPDVRRVCALGGRWAREFQEQWDELPAALYRRDNRRGRSSHGAWPGLILCAPGCDDAGGEAFGVHLAHSGNHSVLVEPLGDGRRQWQLGEWLHPGERVLREQQTFTAPTAYVAFSAQGLNGLAAQFHEALRRHVLRWPDAQRPRPVLLNTWEAVGLDLDGARLERLVDAAAEIGVERFVLDDGWFRGRRSDRAGLGDWWPDARLFPQGLAPLAQRVRERGMDFGLWVEPEMVNPDSELYRAHPDWALGLAGARPVLGRHQLVLDLTRPEVAEHLFAQLDGLLRALPIGYLKWDMNRDLAPAASRGRCVAGDQVRALYALLARLREAHPALEIESCASGGARADYGILAHTHRIWTSDCNDALERIGIQRGFLRFFPPELMGAHIGDARSQTTGRTQGLAFRAAVALAGQLGIESDVAALDAGERARLARWIALHKRLRGVLHGTQVHQGPLADGVTWLATWDGVQQRGVLVCFTLAWAAQPHPPLLRLPFLAAVDRVRLRAVAENDLPVPAGWADLAGDGRVMGGAALAAIGLPLIPMPPESAWVLELQAC